MTGRDDGWPTMAEVEQADVRQLLGWNRFLPSPTDEERPAATRAFERLGELQEADPAAFTAASKDLGW